MDDVVFRAAASVIRSSCGFTNDDVDYDSYDSRHFSLALAE